MYIEVNFVYGILILLIISIIFTNICMKIANFIGEKLIIGDSIINLFNKVKKHR